MEVVKDVGSVLVWIFFNLKALTASQKLQICLRGQKASPGGG